MYDLADMYVNTAKRYCGDGFPDDRLLVAYGIPASML